MLLQIKKPPPYPDLQKIPHSHSDIQINEFITAIIRRYEKLYPDREVVFLSLPKDSQKRSDAIENMIRFIRSCYKQLEA